MFYGLMPEIKVDWIGLDWIQLSSAENTHGPHERWCVFSCNIWLQAK